MREAAEAVIQFNRNLLGIEPRPIAPMPEDEYRHLCKAISEELSEFMQASHDQDLIQMADALLDGIYFAIGGLYKMGLSAEQIHTCFMHIHECNMRKVKGEVAKRAVGNAPDAIKPEDFVAPEMGIALALGLA